MVLIQYQIHLPFNKQIDEITQKRAPYILRSLFFVRIYALGHADSFTNAKVEFFHLTASKKRKLEIV